MVRIDGELIEVRLIDFDVSTLLPEKTNEITLDYDIVGTDEYMAPEIFESYTYSFASDIYALGRMFEIDLNLPPHIYQDMLHDNPAYRTPLPVIAERLQLELEGLCEVEQLDKFIAYLEPMTRRLNLSCFTAHQSQCEFSSKVDQKNPQPEFKCAKKAVKIE
jgi:serine/threonine protein kinase